jgi:hypothetical protein
MHSVMAKNFQINYKFLVLQFHKKLNMLFVTRVAWKEMEFWEGSMIYYTSLVMCSPTYHRGKGMTIWANYFP